MGNPTLNVLKDPRSRKLEEIYARIPKLECQRKCQAGCGLVRAAGAIEDERLQRQVGEWAFEQLEAAGSLDALLKQKIEPHEKARR